MLLEDGSDGIVPVGDGAVRAERYRLQVSRARGRLTLIVAAGTVPTTQVDLGGVID